MILLLDTHAFLWFTSGSEELSVTARAAIELPDNEVLLSLASIWEIGIKVSLGKLRIPGTLEEFIRIQTIGNGIGLLPVELPHIATASALPFHHRDPFDRMLIAQALVEDACLVSRDGHMDAYGVGRLW